MSTQNVRRLAFLVAGLLLLFAPLFVRTVILGYNQRAYSPSELNLPSLASTPNPTALPQPIEPQFANEESELRPGAVIVDMAHGNRVSRHQFQPLAAALANHGIGLHFWTSDIDPMSVKGFLDYPDQSDDLEELLRGASGLISVSPFFMWSREEIAQAEKFVADGGRLLIISDPNVMGDLAQDVNTLAEPFGIVFSDDYLFDTTTNDGNYVYIFPTEFEDVASALADKQIVLYGSRSIAGDVTPQIRTSDTTRSHLRVGVSGLNTMVLGGLASRGTAGGVLAMGDFDVLTAPFVERYDNARLNEFVADFLASGERVMSITDFPEFLGKQVQLIMANGDAVDAETLEESAKLQSSLDRSGRTLTVGGTYLLDTTMTGRPAYFVTEPETDLIVLADFSTAAKELTLLSELGFELVEIVTTPDVTSSVDLEQVEATPTPTGTSSLDTVNGTPTISPNAEPTEALDGEAQDLNRYNRLLPQNQERHTAMPPEEEVTPDPTGTITVTPTATVHRDATASPSSDETATATPTASSTETHTPDSTATVTSTDSATTTSSPTDTTTPTPTQTPTVTPTATPRTETYLVREDGLRLVAADTVLIAQRQMDDGRRVVTVLGNNNEGIRTGISRLLEERYTGCVTSVDMAVCSNPSNDTSDSAAPTSADAADTPVPEEGNGDAAFVPDDDTNRLIMVIDDNDLILPEEVSEADIYLLALTGQGFGPTLWTIATDGIPKPDDLEGYDWVIWSAGGYEAGGPGLMDLEALMEYMNSGGALTISSRKPFFGMSIKPPTSIVDVAVNDDIPAMVHGLPSTPIILDEPSPPVIPLEIGDQHAGAKIVLRRGPQSADEETPLMFVVKDDTSEEASGAKLMVAGLSLTWLPDNYRTQLVENMTVYMLQD